MALLLNGKAYSIVTDQLGTPTEAYNAEGEEVWSRRLDMNGNILEEHYDRYAPYSEQIRIPFLFQGQYYDFETELAYNRFRYYSPELGRYISEDPIRLASGTLALHAYVEDSSGWIDVFGLKATYSKKAQLLREGENGTVVTVKSKKEAHALLMEAFPGAQKVRGIGSQDAQGIRKKRKMMEFKKNDGKVRFRKDYPIDSKTGRVYGHNDPKGVGHGAKPHINIKKEDGTMVRIDIG